MVIVAIKCYMKGPVSNDHNFKNLNHACNFYDNLKKIESKKYMLEV